MCGRSRSSPRRDSGILLQRTSAAPGTSRIHDLFSSLFEAQVVVEKWRTRYNQERPHGALNDPMPTIELLYLDACPSWQHAWNDLGEVLAAGRIRANVRLRNLENMPDNQRHGIGARHEPSWCRLLV